MDSRTPFQVIGLLLVFPVAFAVLPNGECSAPGLTCELENNNVVGIQFDVASEEECKKDCEDISTGCTAFSYFGPAGSPYRDTCILFSNCTTLNPCEDCYTEEVECIYTYCTAPVEGILTDNQVDFIVDVSEAACEAECTIVPECNFFTYHYGNSSTFPDTCFLLTELREPISYCQDGTCISGSPNCNQSICGYLDDGMLYPNGIVVTESKYIDLILLGSCGTPLTVAIGGGGNALNRGGAGSGHVEFVELSSNGPYRKFSASVGAAQRESQLTDEADGYVILTANPGGDSVSGNGGDGGDGYSGGGADCDFGCSSGGGDGGSNGGDGEDSADGREGGQGSGLDISTIPLRNIVLSPGSGGIGSGSSSGFHGGGGGGVRVDGTGPSGGGEAHGNGYGAGGALVTGAQYGYDGVIILDLI